MVLFWAFVLTLTDDILLCASLTVRRHRSFFTNHRGILSMKLPSRFNTCKFTNVSMPSIFLQIKQTNSVEESSSCNLASKLKTGRSVQLLKTSRLKRKVWGSIPGSVKLVTVSPMPRHHCAVSSQLCCPSAKYFGVITRLE